MACQFKTTLTKNGYTMSCLVCGSANLAFRVDFGKHPAASFFLVDPQQKEQAYKLVLGQCTQCGSIQLIQPIPYYALVPPYDWLRSREPEEHLDDAVSRIINEGVLSANSVIGGLSYKDDTTIERFNNLGYPITWRLDLQDDFNITNPAAGIETIQKLVSPARMAQIAKQHPSADLLIARHIIEHSENLIAFIEGLAELVTPNGLLMLEIPDCLSSLEIHEYCMIWEEHSLYFTPETFSLVPALGGFSIIWEMIYKRPFENSLVLLARKDRTPAKPTISEAARSQIGILDGYGKGYSTARQNMQDLLATFRREHGAIALFGAGHLAHAFANFMGVSEFIDFVADDTPQKQGMYLSGSKLPIFPSSELLTRNIKLCLLAVSIPTEPVVIERNDDFVTSGGIFRSILRESSRSIFSQCL